MKFKEYEDWVESDLEKLPNEETEIFEYKSSQINLNQLKNKLSIAASAFWNSGGGIFIAGIDNNGKIDGGISNKVGGQSVRDWADQIISSVEPPGDYEINTIQPKGEGSSIYDEHIVLLIIFKQSYQGPHMAYDNKYYVRAGAHSGPAKHFLVEAIRARRVNQTPQLVGLIKPNEKKTSILDLSIMAINNAPALNVELTFKPLPPIFKKVKDLFPLNIPIIIQDQPYTMEIGIWGPSNDQVFGDKPVDMILSFEDNLGRKYNQEQTLDITSSLSPISIGTDTQDKIRKSLEKIEKELKGTNKILKNQS